MDNQSRRVLASGAALLLSLIVSLSFYVLTQQRSVQRVLFFPDGATGLPRGESRKIPAQNSREAEVEYLIRELILGSTLIQYARALPRDTRVRSVLYRGDALFVDFSQHLVLDVGDLVLGFLQTLEIVRRTLEYNYPGVNHIRFSIAGIEA